jgi:hypothetical protein
MASAITACDYHKTALYYSRIVAICGRRGMLFSGGDFPKRFHRFFRGRDSMKVNKEIAVFSFFHPAIRNHDDFIRGSSPA